MEARKFSQCSVEIVFKRASIIPGEESVASIRDGSDPMCDMIAVAAVPGPQALSWTIEEDVTEDWSCWRTCSINL